MSKNNVSAVNYFFLASMRFVDDAESVEKCIDEMDKCREDIDPVWIVSQLDTVEDKLSDARRGVLAYVFSLISDVDEPVISDRLDRMSANNKKQFKCNLEVLEGHELV